MRTDLRSRWVETIRARAVCLRCGDLDGYDTLTAELDSIVDDKLAEAHPLLPSDRDGHTAPRPV